MPTSFTYLLIDLGAFVVPFIFSFHPKLLFYKQWRFFWPACGIAAVIFIVWDVIYTTLGVWGFNKDYICGISIFNLPLEEVLFFVCIPYSCIFTYQCLLLIFGKKTQYTTNYFSISLSIGLLIFAIANYSRLYTCATFSLTAAFVFFLAVIKKVNWLHHFYLTCIIILFPFFIVNGILTGSWIEAPIVWYNNNENLGIRLLTIPIEDVFYGLLLLLLNAFIFEMLKRKNAKA